MENKKNRYKITDLDSNVFTKLLPDDDYDGCITSRSIERAINRLISRVESDPMCHAFQAWQTNSSDLEDLRPSDIGKTIYYAVIGRSIWGMCDVLRRDPARFMITLITKKANT